MTTLRSRTAARAPLFLTWARLHGVDPTYIVIVVLCWMASALTCWIGLPRLDPSLTITPVNLQQFGLIALAATAGIMSLALTSDTAWLTATSPQPMPLLRLAWCGLSLLTAACLGLASGILLPPGVPLISGYLAVALLWWGVATLCAAVGGRLVGLLAPLALSLVATSKIVPWRFNVVFHPDLGEARMALAGVVTIAAALTYAAVGSARERRSV